MQRLNARWLALLGITLVSLYLCWLIIAPFLDVLIWAIVLAIVAHPIFRKLRERGWSDTLASAATILVVIVVALIPIGIVTASIVAQVPEASEQVQKAIVKGKEMLYTDSRTGEWMRRIVGEEVVNDPSQLEDRVKEMAKPLTQKTLGMVGGVASGLLKVAFALFTLFYLLRDEAIIGRAVMNAMPLDNRQSMEVYKRCRQVIKASVNGTMLIAAIQGALGALAFWVLGIPSALLWGFIMFVMALIPMLGAPVVWIPAAIFLIATGHVGKAIALAVWGGLVIGTLDNVLRPRLVGQRAGFHDLIIFFSVLGGIQVFGILGLFVGPVVVAIAVAIVEVFKQMSPVAVPVTEAATPEGDGSKDKVEAARRGENKDDTPRHAAKEQDSTPPGAAPSVSPH